MEELIEVLQSAAIPQAFQIDLPDEDDLVEIEEEILLPIPSDFKQFLTSVSNLVIGSLEPVTVTDPQAHTHLPEVTAQAWADGMPRDLIAVCSIGTGCYCINPEGEVMLWQSGEIIDDEQWEDIWQWAKDIWLTS
ncbi:SMI1/KNR4 family protein [Aliikangiella marina]|uniref:SMI1/KNR4 family protein n=1 Tax=Aliikangiella marina TaxID=1712262 RepID=A0A545T8S5_9GAMM|nr:SMI1/KNR4 family protein [Aliikangiella marina]TQV73624.1 SMI1/KNR4 family protein [Aliikangiella marina]